MKGLSRCFIYASALFAFGFSACSPVPDGILSQNEMRAVLVDMQVAEAMMSADHTQYKEDAQKLALYESVFRKHGLTRAEYDSSLMWYARNLDIYMRVYNLVSKDVQERIDALGDVEREDFNTGKRDSVDIWSRRSFLTFSPQSPFNGTTFNITPQEAFPPGSSFVLGMNVWGIRSDMKQRPEIRLCVDQGDTIVTVNDKVRQDGYHLTELKSIPTKRIKRVYGYIRLDNGGMNYYKIYADSISLMRYNYKSVGFKQAD